MKASTVFSLAIALLIGLAAAAAAKYAGLFEKKPAVVVAEKPTPTKALVAKANLFEDVAVTSTQVAVRDLTPDEEKALAQRFGAKVWKDKLMPALPSAAHLRFPKHNVPVDQILLRDHFSDPLLPEELSKRLDPNTRAVNVTLSKDKAAGGALRIGEYVDVLLTTKIGVGKKEETRTACIARDCKIVMKRNQLWSIMASDPDDKPMHFTLQANPYRAALIEYAQSRGQLSLQPVPNAAASTGSFSDPTSPEYASEDERVEGMRQGTLAIGDQDLARVFRIATPKLPASASPAAQPTPPPPPKPPTIVRHMAGVQDSGRTILGEPTWPATAISTSAGSETSTGERRLLMAPVARMGSGNNSGSGL